MSRDRFAVVPTPIRTWRLSVLTHQHLVTLGSGADVDAAHGLSLSGQLGALAHSSNSSDARSLRSRVRRAASASSAIRWDLGSPPLERWSVKEVEDPRRDET